MEGAVIVNSGRSSTDRLSQRLTAINAETLGMHILPDKAILSVRLKGEYSD